MSAGNWRKPNAFWECSSAPDGESSATRGSSHKVLAKDGYPDYVFSFYDRDEIGPRMMGRIAKKTGLKPEDL